MINDYTLSGVNLQTVKRAPPEAVQWGKALHCLLWYVFMADQRHRPVLLSKTDLSDSFYQLHLTPSGANLTSYGLDRVASSLICSNGNFS